MGIPVGEPRVQPHQPEQPVYRLPGFRHGGNHVVGFDGLDNLAADPVDRVQGVHGGLKYHGYAAPAVLLQGGNVHRHQVLAVQQHLSLND